MSNAFEVAKAVDFGDGTVEAFKNVGKRAIVRESASSWQGREVTIVGYSMLGGGRYLIKADVGLNRWASENDLYIIQ